MVLYQIYRKKIVFRNGRYVDIFASSRGWVPYSSRMYKTRSYVDDKVYHLNLSLDGYFYRVATLEQEEFSF